MTKTILHALYSMSQLDLIAAYFTAAIALCWLIAKIVSALRDRE